MREYELAFIITTEIDEATTSEMVDKIRGWITELGGSIEKENVLGRKKLSYMIRKQKEGQYFIFDVKLPTTGIAVLERRLQLQESILRYLTLKRE
ncbi:MAG: 30S ribosomal protein S6 [Anaerolineaceae bacterium 4572_5.1]|nr:MAG: 30S ribosomal protein S6 [Anaerolinea sp. 4484_236]OQY30567.1 MAG: 30S ribosomal protein S6 [Anaerolineaceae bacterium 4572_5.1]